MRLDGGKGNKKGRDLGSITELVCDLGKLMQGWGSCGTHCAHISEALVGLLNKTCYEEPKIAIVKLKNGRFSVWVE